MYPRSLAQSIIIAVAGILILYLTFRTTKSAQWSLSPHRAPPALPHKPPRVLQNPYTSWWLAWHQEQRTHTLVVAKLKDENVAWLENELDVPNLEKAIYVVDDTSAPLHTPMNKGNEAMVYLSYMIDFYDKLPDVSTFVHSHASAWHVSDILNSSSAEMLRRLSLEKVTREGYVNLRCELFPGCPVSAQLDRIDDGDPESRMNEKVAAFMLEMFPEEEMPTVLAGACCAQFSLSREYILRHPKSYYIKLRKWIMETDLPKVITGRVFEYVWHYLFTGQPTFCPSEQICYCDAYAVCFPTKAAWFEYQDIHKTKKALLEEHKSLPEDSPRRKELSVIIDGLQEAADRRKQEAYETGSNGVVRQQILYDAWEDLKFHGEL